MGLPMHGDGDALDALNIGAEAANECLKLTGGCVAHRVRDVQGGGALKEGGREGGGERKE